MPRTFVRASSQYLQVASAWTPAAGVHLAVAIRFKTSNLTDKMGLFWIGDKDSAGQYCYAYLDGGYLYGEVNALRSEVCSTQCSDGVWHTGVVNFGISGNGHVEVSLDGAAFDEGGSVNTTMTGYDRIAIGRYAGSVPTDYLDGDIAWVFAQQTFSLDDSIALAAGCHPLLVKPYDGTVANANRALWQFGQGFRESDDDLFGVYDLTATNAPTWTEGGEELFYPRPGYIPKRGSFKCVMSGGALFGSNSLVTPKVPMSGGLTLGSSSVQRAAQIASGGVTIGGDFRISAMASAWTAIEDNLLTRLTVTAPFPAGTALYYYWFIDGAYVGMTSEPNWTLALEPGEQVRVDCWITEDADYDPLAAPPAGWPSRRTLWWVRSLAADVDYYRVDQSVDGGAWSEVGRVAMERGAWEYSFFTGVLTDLSVYTWRVVPVDFRGVEGTALTFGPETIVRTPTAPDFTATLNETTTVTFAEA
jgi:hypothetical protein